MEQILRGEEVAIDAIVEDAFSYSNQVVYFPVRHHSVACSYHLQKVLEEYQPDCILIEGPESANEMLDIMAHPDTEAPFAIYYSYKDDKGYVSKEKEAYKCYYPFLDYSPELVAVRYGVIHEVHTAFFDLPYAEILIASAENKGLRKKEEKNNYNDDYYLAKSRFFESLVEKSEVRSFDEFWEKHFELNGLSMSTKEFVTNMLSYCVLSRVHSDEEELKADGCLKREAYMYCNIQETKKQYRKILVVTGGFHTYGLLRHGAEESMKLHSISKEQQGVYLMSYSMEAADGLNGYASGMPFCNFYQHIFERIQENDDFSKAYSDTVLQYLVSVGKEVRKKDGYLSTFDEICAAHMAGNLANLRGKDYPGAYELYDSVLSSFVKGEYNFATGRPMEILRKQMTGKKIGKLCKNAKIPPLVQDFEALARTYRIKIGTSVKSEVVLSIFSSKRHREISCFLYQMTFLDTHFAIRQKGPDLRMKKDRNLIREIWSYKWSSAVIAALVDASVYGGTLQEACASLVAERLKEDMNAKTASDLLIQIFEMGLSKQLGIAITRLEQLLRTDEDFFSLVKAFSNVIMLDELGDLYQSKLPIKPLIRAAYQKVMSTLPHMAQIKDEDLQATMEAVKTLNALLNREEYRCDLESYLDILRLLLEEKDVNAGLEGAVRGILYGRGVLTADSIGKACVGYMAGTQEKQQRVAYFLQGVFYTARDVLFVGEHFLFTLDSFVANVTDEDFMQMLPQLRVAFSYFTPREIDELAEKVAGIYGKDKVSFKQMQAVTPKTYQYGKQLEKEIWNVMEKRHER